MPLRIDSARKPQFSLLTLLWLPLAVACIFLGRQSTRWQEEELSLRNLTFCEQVQSYGQIEPVAESCFRSGQGVMLYVEVRNVSHKALGDTLETSLAGDYQILDSAYSEASAAQLPVDRQQWISHKTDHFIAYQLRLPELLDGEYILRMTVRDENSGRSSEATVPFQIASSDL